MAQIKMKYRKKFQSLQGASHMHQQPLAEVEYLRIEFFVGVGAWRVQAALSGRPLPFQL